MIGAAAAVAVALSVTVSAYAGVLPDSLQDVAHSVINAPKSHHDRTDQSPAAPSQNGPAAGVGTSTSDPAAVHDSGARTGGSTATESTSPGAPRTGQQTGSAAHSGSPSSDASKGHGKTHARTTPTPPQIPAPTSTP